MSRIGQTSYDKHIFGPPPRHCPCCGTAESTSGCVRGFGCVCSWEFCYICHKCIKHCTCPGGPERDIVKASAKLHAKRKSDEP